MINIKKKFLYIIISTLFIVILIVVMILVFKPFNNNSSDSKTKTTQEPVIAPTKATAEALKEQAAEASKVGDLFKTKTLIQEAEKQYVNLGNTGSATDAATDAAAQQYFIDHQPATPTLETPKLVSSGGTQ